MSRKIDLKNNFGNFKQDFKKDTGLDADQNMDAYIQYVNARLADYNFQMNWEIMNELINLPDLIKFKTGN
ncbi:MAG: hypothetical protein U5L09_10410 [Bacteroidales bacterium]|nr:hypothetical protein [Bacteroidales bacterium]